MISALYRDLWVPVWPNLAASALWAPGALWWHHSRLRKHVTAEIGQVRASMIERKFEEEECP